jgi:hypothetical protein
MEIDKEEMLRVLLELFYDYALRCDKEGSEDYNKGYRDGMLKDIDAVNKYAEM